MNKPYCSENLEEKRKEYLKRLYQMPDKVKCKWIIREGNGFRFWAYTPCERGFNPLTRIKNYEQIKPYYDGRCCPSCGKPIECDIELVSGEVTEWYI